MRGGEQSQHAAGAVVDRNTERLRGIGAQAVPFLHLVRRCADAYNVPTSGPAGLTCDVGDALIVEPPDEYLGDGVTEHSMLWEGVDVCADVTGPESPTSRGDLAGVDRGIRPVERPGPARRMVVDVDENVGTGVEDTVQLAQFEL
ncbi:hypothetical protein [Nocardia farcinica]|uniref:hypothetical protein n=1 Tax=Nocardia farcinica TaxID=37329 RepID=UPI0005A1A40C|nr:hypothetical protein [Nocardia farcinica]